MKRRTRAVSAALLTTAALAGSSPEIPVASRTLEKPKMNNRANKLAKRLTKHIGGRILRISRSGKGEQTTSSIGITRYTGITVIFDNKTSLVPGSSGEYVLRASGDTGKNKMLDQSDINRVQVAEGGAPDGAPLFTVGLYHLNKPWHSPADGLRDANRWFYAKGTAIDASGDRSVFEGGTNTSPCDGPESLKLGPGEVQATGRVMEELIDEALGGHPTHLEEPPFGSVQR